MGHRPEAPHAGAAGGAFGVAIGLALLGDASGPALLAGAKRTWLTVALIHAAMFVPLLATRVRSTPHGLEPLVPGANP